MFSTEPSPKQSTGWLKGFSDAFRGLKWMFRSERNARVHLLLAISIIAAGFILKISVSEWCLVTICIVSVIAAEAFNTALEYLCDFIEPKFHPIIGKVKDLAAGAVLIISVGALTVGALIFLPKLFIL